jgi:NitT/TauT family transport system permease protein
MMEQSSTQSVLKPRATRESIQKALFRYILPIAILIVLWQTIAYIASRHLQNPISIFDIAEAFVKLSIEGDTEGRTLLEHTSLSMFRVALGFLVAAATAIPLGIAIGRYKIADWVLGPVVEATRPIPPIAWIPISILMFQANFLGSQVFIIWIGAFFPILINTTTGVKRTEPVHIDVAHTFGANERQILKSIVIPSASPEIFAGLKVGFGIGWMCLVAAEMIGGGLGLGYLVLITEQLGRTAQTICAMLMIGVIGFVISYIFLLLERSVTQWRQAVSI